MKTLPWLAALGAALNTIPILPASGAEAAQAAAKSDSAGWINDQLRREIPNASAWDLGGQFRVRYEARQNAGSFPNRDFISEETASNDYFLFRTKIHLGWRPSDWVHLYVEGRDSRDVSDERATTETDELDLHQTFVVLGDPKQFPVTLKVGRQELLYGDERYIGISDWSNTGRTFDLARLRYEIPRLTVDLFSGRQVLVRDGHFNVANDYDWFSGVEVSTRNLVPWQDTEFYVLSRNVGVGSPAAITSSIGGPGARDIYTVGTRWKSIPGKLGGWDYVFEAAGQFGSIASTRGRLDHQAFALDLTGSYTWKDAFGSPRLNAGYDFSTGDDDPGDLSNGTFELLFGTNHRLYGLMDLFGLRNVHIPRVGASIKPVKDLTVSLEWLGFWLAETADFLYPETGAGRSQNGYGRNPTFDPYVGQELDLTASWKVRTWAELQAGYGHFFAGDYIRQSATAGGHVSQGADWLYLQVKLTF